MGTISQFLVGEILQLHIFCWKKKMEEPIQQVTQVMPRDISLMAQVLPQGKKLCHKEKEIMPQGTTFFY